MQLARKWTRDEYYQMAETGIIWTYRGPSPDGCRVVRRVKRGLRLAPQALPNVELSVDEVATALQIPEATVRTRFFRARGLLRESLAKEADVALASAFSFAGARCDRIIEAVMMRIAAAA